MAKIIEESEAITKICPLRELSFRICWNNTTGVSISKNCIGKDCALWQSQPYQSIAFGFCGLVYHKESWQ